MLSFVMFSSTFLSTYQMPEYVCYMGEEDIVIGKISDLFKDPQSVAELICSPPLSHQGHLFF